MSPSPAGRLPAVMLLVAAVASAQQLSDAVEALRGADSVRRERACRDLLAAAPGQLPIPALQELLRQDWREHGLLAARLLAKANALPDEFAVADEDRAAALALRSTAFARRVLAAADESSDVRIRALFALQDRGALTAADLALALASDDDALQWAAANLWRHEWRDLPAGLVPAAAAPAVQAVLLRVLAQAPRPAARRFVERCWQDDRLPFDLRCLALAAHDQPLQGAAIELLLRALREEPLGEGGQLFLQLLPEAAADALVGRIHAWLLAGVPVTAVAPVFDRLSPRGATALLGLVGTLPLPVADELCAHLDARGLPAYRERLRAALDGEIPLEPHWLLRAGPLLDVPARQQRVLDLLRDGVDPDVKQRAFVALLEARFVHPLVCDFALQDASRRRRLVERCAALLPSDVQLAVLAGDDAAAVAFVNNWHQPWPEPAEAVLLARLARGLPAQRQASLANAFALAIAAHGSEAALRAMWPLVRGDVWLVADVVERLGQRAEPFVVALLRAELQQQSPPVADGEPATVSLHDHVRLALVRLGDQEQLRGIVARAARLEPPFVRRCRHVVPAPDLGTAQALLAAAQQSAAETANELLLWAGGCAAPEVGKELLQIWQRADDPEFQDAALRGLMRGPMRELLLGQLRAASQGPLDERWSSVAYEAIAAMAPPLSVADAELLAELCLLSPLRDVATELTLAVRFPEGRVGFPMVAAIAQRLRGAAPELVVPAFAAAATRAIEHPDVRYLARSRLLVLWSALVADPPLQQAIGEATAALLLAVPDAEDRGAGAAHLYLASRAEREGRFAAAADAARHAARLLLRTAEQGIAVRIFLGERDPFGGNDPWAALAAWPHVLQARAHVAAAAFAAARDELTLAREFAGRDRTALALIATLSAECNR